MTTGKRQPPLWLDMSFAEALERFGQTDSKEIKTDADSGDSAIGPVKKAKSSRKTLGNVSRRRMAGPKEI